MGSDVEAHGDKGMLSEAGVGPASDRNEPLVVWMPLVPWGILCTVVKDDGYHEGYV